MADLRDLLCLTSDQPAAAELLAASHRPPVCTAASRITPTRQINRKYMYININYASFVTNLAIYLILEAIAQRTTFLARFKLKHLLS